ncbi:maleate cis-trans isomerase family protein [Nocardioides panzhihuensis]|uniref:Maleate isomerase n=1 Tax=Nocardioides panzhihuensis TaxID=860243 RepID=A0A7Z0DRE6_9ACTN|nr:maleate cis-trans isomerase [Nocardioides panzhihuensis]NYI80399.1 maleate isomerase [Nocardioides panzhihuensis]
MTHIRVGLVVPSSNVTVETELPKILSRHPEATFSFHGSRMRMHQVSPEGLARMNAQRERCVIEIADAAPDVILYACLVAIMVGGPDEHRRVEGLVAEQLATGKSQAGVRSSAGALVEGLHALGAKRVGLVMPYMRPLAQQVVEYIESEGFDVLAWRALEVEDNHAVGCIPNEQVMEAARSIDTAELDALVISCCVQMPSLDLVDLAEKELGIPVISAATAGAYSILAARGLPLTIPGAGSLLSRDLAVASA